MATPASPSPWGSLQLFDDPSRRVVDATEADQQLVRNYPDWLDKGPPADGTRLTLTTARLDVAVGDALRIAHIVEEQAAGRLLFGVGPKPVRDEFIDGVLATAATPGPGDYPWLPPSYDGEAAPAPGIDDNFEITEYRFDRPGQHRIQWCPGSYRSNVLRLTVREPP